MITGTTKTGFEFQLADNVLDDYELLEALCAIDSGNYGKVPAMVDALLGTDQVKKLKDHIRKNGKVSSAALVAEVFEILTAAGGKNS